MSRCTNSPRFNYEKTDGSENMKPSYSNGPVLCNVIPVTRKKLALSTYTSRPASYLESDSCPQVIDHCSRPANYDGHSLVGIFPKHLVDLCCPPCCPCVIGITSVSTILVSILMNGKVPIWLFQCSSPARNSLLRIRKTTTDVKSSSLRTRRDMADATSPVRSQP